VKRLLTFSIASTSHFETRRPYNQVILLLMTSRTCSDADSPLVIVTPRIFRLETLATSGNIDNSGTPCFLRLSVNIISRVLVLFSYRLFSRAQLSTWSISLHRVSAQLASTMMYVSSAYLTSRFRAFSGSRSLAVTT